MDISQLYALEMMRKRRLRQSTGYRTEDLVLHLDGIQNTRAGTHNPSATVWEDLAGNMDVTLYNATWGENYAGFAGDIGSYGRGGRWTFTTGITIEVVFERTGAIAAYGSTLAGWPLNSNGSMFIRPSLVANTAAINVRYDARTGYTGVNVGTSPALNTKYYLSCGGGIMRQSAAAYTHSQYLYPIGQTYLDFMLANYLHPTGENVSGIHLAGRIYAVRVYDANLTAEELYAHWLIDKARFNIPEA